jgi:probable rRNA maturation factor
MADSDSRPSPSTRKRGASDPRLRKRASSEPRLHVEIVTSAHIRAAGLAAWLQAIAPVRARGSVTIAIVPDDRVQSLNRRFRRMDKPTDVLSFPAGERGYLGDVVIAAGVAARQAREAGHSLQTELRILALHGLLHLLGYDHETDDGRMAKVERRLRAQGGLREGLIERVPRPTPRGAAR